jgi:cellulose synthase/poly-beta-1,6-N-acetylglucosamine synthase-like glycosyltransferase
MISFLLTAWKEDKTIGKAIECLVKPDYSGYAGEFELLVVAPDKETEEAAIAKVTQLGITTHYRYFRDESKGKPRALNILFKEAKGDILVLTDGEVFLQQGAVKALVDKFKSDPETGGVSGRPIALNPKNNLLGYWAHLQADAVHQMRLDRDKRQTGKFFPMSGYVMAVRNLGYKFPEDLFLDDAYLSYDIFNRGYQISYAPEARVEVKYPTSWNDFIKQKFRSLIGFEQLWKYEIIKPETKSRSFSQEIGYFWFPLKYAHNLGEFIWSLLYYPVRLYLWVRNRFARDLAHNATSIRDVYVRTETTK